MIPASFSLSATERILPRLALDFTSANLDARITVSRALNTATRINEFGLVATVNANLPRFDYDPSTLICKGLLIEESRTNIAVFSEQFDNVIWNKGTGGVVSSDTVVSPDGTLDADSYTWASTTSSFAFLSQTIAGANATQAHTFSVWLKRPAGSGNRTIRLVLTDVNISTGESATFTVTESWQRFFYTRTSANNTGFIGIGFNLGGSGTSIAAGDVLEVWGAQLEAGAFATSYIPTTTTSLTRNADVVSMTGTNFSSWYSAGSGAFQISVIPQVASGTRPLIQADDNTANNIISLRQNIADPELYIVSGGTLQAQIDAGAVLANTAYRLAGAWANNNCAAAQNGGVASTDLSATIPTPTQLRIGSDGANFGNLWMIKINYWPQRITNPEVSAFSK